MARGLCVEDGKSICRLSSRDQVTHWVHGLWRYWRSGLVPDELKDSIRAAFADVAGLMERNVTEANGWNFLQADGTPDPRGICKMRETMPHEAARLAMVYAAAGEVTGDAKWTKLYKSLREEALDGSCRLANLAEKDVARWMPSYTLHQMNASLEVLLGIEKSVKYRAKIISAMVTCARIARERATSIRGNDSRWLCGCAAADGADRRVRAERLPGGDPRERDRPHAGGQGRRVPRRPSFRRVLAEQDAVAGNRAAGRMNVKRTKMCYNSNSERKEENP